MYNKIGLQGRLVSDPRWKRVIQDGEPTEIVEFLLSVERDEPVDSWGFRKADCFKVIVKKHNLEQFVPIRKLQCV